MCLRVRRAPRARSVALAVSACGLRIETDGAHTVQTRTVGSFDRVDLRGSTDVDAAVDGSGDLDLGDVVAQSATVNLSGSGDADVHAVRALSAVVSGSGDVGYAGNPRVTRDISGSGDVSRR